MIIERALTEEERESIRRTASALKIDILKMLGFVLVVPIAMMFILINKKGAHIEGSTNYILLPIVVGVILLVIMLYMQQHNFKMTSELNWLLKKNTIKTLRIKPNKAITYVFDKNIMPAHIFQYTNSSLLVLQAGDYYNFENDFPTNDIEVRFFTNDKGKDTLYEIIATGEYLEPKGEVSGQLPSTLKNTYEDPATFSLVDGSFDDIENVFR